MSAASGDATGIASRALNKAPVIICPAQFGTAQDYEELLAELEARGHPAVPLDLGRFDWLKITRSIFTPDYWQGTLKPVGSLDFYLDAIKAAVDEVKARYPKRKIHLVAHSIGGWIARAYLGEVCGPEERRSFASLTTLGSPHLPPEGDFWTNLDQTRGLLSYVTQRFPGAYHPEIKYICVCGTDSPGGLVEGLEASVAYVSYLPLCGDGQCMGDGIVPESIAFLEGAVQVRLPGVKHASFIPTAGRSIRLPNYVWYGTGEIVDKWIVHLPKA